MARNAAAAPAQSNVPAAGQRGFYVAIRYEDSRGLQWEQYVGLNRMAQLIAKAAQDPKVTWIHVENWDLRFQGKSWPKNPETGMGQRPITHPGESW